VLAPHADMWSDNRDIRLFTLVRPLSTSYSSKTYGYIAVQRSVDAIYRLPFWAREDGAEYALLDAAGTDVSPAGALLDLGGVASQFPESGEAATLSAKLDGRSVSVFSSGVGETGWTLVRALPTGLLDAPYSLVYTQLVLLGALLLAILLFVVYLLEDRISRPLR